MTWLYAFGERDEQRYAKIGFAKEHYHRRFAKTLQCNPRLMEIVSVWRFATEIAAKGCESKLKKEMIFNKWLGGGTEWYSVAPRDIAADLRFQRMLMSFHGVSETPVPFAGPFIETLNLGACDRNGRTFRPHLYLLAERPHAGTCKIALSCYNWPTVAAHYTTYNPRPLEIVGRWFFAEALAGNTFWDSLNRRFAACAINPLGWYRIPPDEVASMVEKSGVAAAYPRITPIDEWVDYTGSRVPVH